MVSEKRESANKIAQNVNIHDVKKMSVDTRAAMWIGNGYVSC